MHLQLTLTDDVTSTETEGSKFENGKENYGLV